VSSSTTFGSSLSRKYSRTCLSLASVLAKIDGTVTRPKFSMQKEEELKC
jgi:hypothetical protein